RLLSFDRHPFVVPSKQGRITTSAEFATPETLPPYFKAVTPTSKPAETVFLLRGLGGDHAPRRCRFTQLSYGGLWNVPLRDMNDSCFVLYWENVEVKGNAEAKLSFDCGVGLPNELLRSLSAPDGNGQ